MFIYSSNSLFSSETVFASILHLIIVAQLYFTCLVRRLKELLFIEVGKLFDRKWKPYKPNAIIDNDTLPSMTNIVRTRDFAEAMALNRIVKELMNSSEGSSVTYSND